jgi:phosphatidylglycerophosphatase A
LGKEPNYLNKLAILIATGFGSGYSPFASGTAGSLVGLVIFWGISGLSPLPYFLLLVILFLIGWYCAGVAEKNFKEKDSSRIVVDEIHGMLLTLWALPHHTTYIIAGFFLFRLFDVWKPFPARYLERKVPGGLGVMLDDTAAALYANGILHGVRMLNILG